MGDPVTTMIIVDVALMAASAAMTASQKFTGPRLSETEVSLSEYGTPLPRFWGIRRFETPIIWAEKLTEKKKTSKGKGGKNTQYTYKGTWAVAVADHEIDSVSRIWLDRHLSYDVTGVGPVSLAPVIAQFEGDDSVVKLGLGTNMRIYLGTEDQEPDPRITAWCEDRYGADTCPAYRGVAYIVFQDIPLEKFGNRIPQISVEAIHTKSDAFPYEEVAGVHPLFNSGISPDGSTLISTTSVAGVDYINAWDLPSRTLISTANSPFTVNGHDIAVVDSTSFYAMASGTTALWLCDIHGSGANTGTVFDAATDGGCQLAGGRVWVLPSSSGIHNFSYSTGEEQSTSFGPSCFFADADFAVWAIGPVGSSSGNIGLLEIATGTTTIIATGYDTDCGAMDNGDGSFFVYQTNGKCFLIDKVTKTITHTSTDNAGGFQTSDLRRAFTNVKIGSPIVYVGFQKWDTRTGELTQTISPSSWIGVTSSNTLYDPVNHALMSEIGTGIIWRYLDRVASDGVTLQTVVDDVADWCGLTGQDTAALTQIVPGYSVTQGSGKDMIAPLLDIHDVDPRPHDFAVQFVNRGSSAAGTITTSELAREGDENRYVASITQDTDLPRKITFNFADKGFDQQANNVIAQRPLDSVDGKREQTIDLGTYVADASTAQKFADRYLRRQWIGRDKFTLSLTAQRLALEPADVYNLELDGITTTARLTKVTLSNGRLNTEWDRDFPSITTLGTGTGSPMDGRDPEVIYIPGPTKGFVKDIPLLSDADSNTNPLLYYAAGPYTSTQNWPGAYIMQGDPDGVDFDIEWNALDSSQGATWGAATDVLADANPNLWDRGNSVNVKGNLTLTSVTEADIDTDPALNLALLGEELLNFATATLEADGSYTLSGLKRGRRGTEWATADHAIGETFVLTAAMLNEGEGLSDVGTTLHFKAQTLGRSIEAASAISFDFTGASLKPYAPARVNWTTDGTDLFGEIIRRTRVGGSWVGGSTIPLSENSEAYEVDVYHLTTFKRTISVSGTNLFTYTAAMMAADSNVVGTPPPINAYQISDAVGRGFALAA